MARTTDNAAVTAATLAALGNAYQSAAQYPQALEALTEAQIIFSQTENEPKLRTTLSKIAKIHQEMGNTEAAIATYQTLISSLNGSEDTKARAQTLETVGALHGGEERYGEARLNYQNAASLWAQLGDSDRQINALTRTGQNSAALNEISAGMDAYNQALAIAQQSANREKEAGVLKLQGDLLLSAQRYNEAATAYRQEANVWQDLDENERAIRSYLALAKLYSNSGQGGAILPSYQQALNLATATNDTRQIATIHEAIGGYYRTVQQYPEALDN